MTDREVDADFPSLNLHPDRVLYRVHRAANDPLYFSSTGIGRFDLARIAGMGTCYLSASPIGAYVETLGRLGTLNRGDVHERRLSELALVRTLRVGDLTDRTILGRYGIAGDLSVGAGYRPAHELSDGSATTASTASPTPPVTTRRSPSAPSLCSAARARGSCS